MEEELGLKERPISQEEWLSHYKVWQKSNQSKKEYCRQHDLKSDNFYSWCYRFKSKETRCDESNEKDVFIPIVAKEASVDLSEKISTELLLPNAIRLKVLLSPKMLLKLIGELSDAATIIR